jgi:hypothetical protein
MVACLPTPTLVPPLPTEALPPTLTSTPTIVWFPPTATYTPIPALTLPVTPTLDAQSLFGSLIFADDFSQAELWALGRTTAGSMALGKSELSLVVSQPDGYLYSQRKGTDLKDYYLEITASPSICRGGDEYGLLLRISPSQDYYRFALSCDGQARLDRLVDGEATSPQPPVMNWAIPPGAPSSSRLGAWLVGKEMRFYVNNEHIFTVNDPLLPRGGLGVFARASSEDSVTVNFSDLRVYEALK